VRGAALAVLQAAGLAARLVSLLAYYVWAPSAWAERGYRGRRQACR
jgi:hypothetical protein